LLICAVAILCACGKKSLTQVNDQTVTLSKIVWIADTTLGSSLIFGHVLLFVEGRTTGDSVTVRTFGDGLISNIPLLVDLNSTFSDTIEISFTSAATTAKFTKSTVMNVYRGGALLDSFVLTSDSLCYYRKPALSLIYKYSIDGQNVDSLDTYRHTFTRFFCRSAGAGDSTVPFSFSTAEEDSLIALLVRTDFFNKPDTLTTLINDSTGLPVRCMVMTPSTSYYVKIRLDDLEKTMTFTTNDYCKMWGNESVRVLFSISGAIGAIYITHAGVIALPAHGCLYD